MFNQITSRLSSAMLVTALALSASSAQAAVTYFYTGLDFQVVTSPFSTSDNITGSVTFSSALGVAVPYGPVTPIAFSFSDGVGAPITNLNDLTATFDIGTGQGGQFMGWDIAVTSATGGISIQNTFNVNGYQDAARGSNEDQLGRSYQDGSWSVGQEDGGVSGVPEASTWAMMILGFVGVGFLGYRRQANATVATA